MLNQHPNSYLADGLRIVLPQELGVIGKDFADLDRILGKQAEIQLQKIFSKNLVLQGKLNVTENVKQTFISVQLHKKIKKANECMHFLCNTALKNAENRIFLGRTFGFGVFRSNLRKKVSSIVVIGIFSKI